MIFPAVFEKTTYTCRFSWHDLGRVLFEYMTTEQKLHPSHTIRAVSYDYRAKTSLQSYDSSRFV